jgi:putative hemolysin
MDPLPAFLIIFSLLLASGIFSLFEYALSACRKARLEKEPGNIYRAVLEAHENPVKLSLACRLWINLLRIAAAIFFGMIIMQKLMNAHSSIQITIAAVSALLLGLLAALLGDALPKLVSRAAPEKISAVLLVPVKILAIPMMPFIIPSLKFASLFRSALHIEEASGSFTEDELRHALLEGEKSGVVESSERTMVEGVFYLGDRPVAAFMTHRSEIQCLDFNEPYEEIRQKALENRKQRCFPVIDKTPDDIVGAVYLEDIILDFAQSMPLGLRAIMKKAQFVPETMSALKAFESFKQSQANSLFVMDEYGGLAGVISITALVEEIVGELSAPAAKDEPLKKQEDGSWLADGALKIDDAAKELSLAVVAEEGDFHTLAGFILSLAGVLPNVGDSFDYQGYRFTVKEMAGNRIDKLLISKIE